MAYSNRLIWLGAKDYIFIVLGISLYAFGFTAFIYSNHVVIGGLTGIGTIIDYTTGIPVAVSQYAFNLILLAFAYKLVGKQFVVRTIFGATAISVLIGIFQPIKMSLFGSAPLLNGDPFISVVLGGLCCGVGIGMAFTHNGSTGGTDIVAAMVSKHTNVSVGRTMLYTDFGIIMSSVFIEGTTIDTITYGFVVLFLASWTADQIINTNRQAVQFTIFSPYWEEIATAINNEANRGCTVIEGTGWYSKQSVKVLMVMCRKIESVTIFRIIKSIDKDAFITQANVNGVYGKGFDELKLKMKPKPSSGDDRKQ